MRHVHRGAFVAHVDDAHVELCQVIPDRLDVAALQPEDAVDAARHQEAGDQFGDAAAGAHESLLAPRRSHANARARRLTVEACNPAATGFSIDGCPPRPPVARETRARPAYSRFGIRRDRGMGMKICVVGAGAIGGFIGTKLALGGAHDVAALARGPTLAALRQHGWRLRQRGTLLSAPVRAASNAAELGAQDLVVIAVKGQSLPEVAPTLAPLMAPHTLVLPAMNGVPWWFGRGVAALEGQPLASVDPGGVVGAALRFEQVIGCVVHASTSTSEPGLVEHNMGPGLIVGEPAGGDSARVTALADALRVAGFDVTASPNVRRDIWYKLW